MIMPHSKSWFPRDPITTYVWGVMEVLGMLSVRGAPCFYIAQWRSMHSLPGLLSKLYGVLSVSVFLPFTCDSCLLWPH